MPYAASCDIQRPVEGEMNYIQYIECETDTHRLMHLIKVITINPQLHKNVKKYTTNKYACPLREQKCTIKSHECMQWSNKQKQAMALTNASCAIQSLKALRTFNQRNRFGGKREKGKEEDKNNRTFRYTKQNHSPPTYV